MGHEVTIYYKPLLNTSRLTAMWHSLAQPAALLVMDIQVQRNNIILRISGKKIALFMLFYCTPNCTSAIITAIIFNPKNIDWAKSGPGIQYMHGILKAFMAERPEKQQNIQNIEVNMKLSFI